MIFEVDESAVDSYFTVSIMNLKLLVGTIVYYCWGLLHSSNSYAAFTNCDHALAMNDRVLRTNQFAIQRDGEDAAALGDLFLNEVNELPENSHFFESGAGEAHVLRQLTDGQFLRGKWVQLKSQKITALGIAKPESPSITALANNATRRFRYLEGKYLEDYALAEIGTCDFIFDQYGAFSYTARIDLVIRKYLELLKVGGKMYLDFKPSGIAFVERPNGLEDYLKKIPNIQFYLLNQGSLIRLVKTGTVSPESIPELLFRNFIPSIPPVRVY